MKRYRIGMKWWALLLLVGILAVACGPAQDLEDEAAASTAFAQGEGSEEVSEDESAEAATEEPAADEPAADEPVDSGQPSDFDLYAGIDEGDVETTESGLQYILLEEGDGESIETGRIVQIHVTGMLDDGTVFLNTRDRGLPAPIPFGEPTGIPGLDEAITN